MIGPYISTERRTEQGARRTAARRRTSSAGLRLFIAAALLLTTPAIASALTWPGEPPCAGTLQGCIDAAAPRDVVEIATNAPIDESVRIEKSLTLRAAAGFVPVLQASNSVAAFAATDGDRTITIEGLTVERGSIRAVQLGSGVFTISILNNAVQNTFSAFSGAIEVGIGNSQATHGSTIFNVSGNSVTVEVAPTDRVSGIRVCCFLGGTNTGIVAHNVITQHGGGDADVIEVGNATVDLNVDIIGNQVTGSQYDNGISIFQFGSGNTTSRIINNLLTGQSDGSALPGGISLDVSQGSGHFEVINNTLTNNMNGIVVFGRPDLGAVLTGFAANNIIAFNAQNGVNIEHFTDTFANRFNLLFGNGSDFVTPGPGTSFGDPAFVSAADYHVGPSSPAVDAGNTADVPADITTDLDGNPRIARRVVDRGAYERQLGCAGDCDGDGAVSINELILGVSMALGRSSLDDCPAFDADGSSSIGIDELIAAVNSALGGCAAPHTPTATRMATQTRTPTAMETATAMQTPSATDTEMPIATRTRTPGMSCGASAPECFGTCPIRRICEPDGKGGCHCVLIDDL